MFEITIDNRQVLAALAQLQHRANDLSPAMREISELLMFHTEEAFDAEGPDWPKLADATRKQREKLGYTGKMLERSGQLKSSLSTVYGRDFAGIGSNKVYAAIHQFGGTIQHAARSQHAYFKQHKDGSVGNRFVKKAHSNFAQRVTIGAHDTAIPARPYLPITADGELKPGVEDDVLAIVRRFLAG